MIRVAHLADLHLDERNRLEDAIEVLSAFLAEARESNLDLIAIAGDFFERRSTPAERNALAEFLIEASEIAPVRGVRGNHDAPGDLDVFSLLRGSNGLQLCDRPGLDRISRVAVYGLPWFDKSHLVARMPDADARSTTEAAIQAARGLLDVARAQVAEAKRDGYLTILVGHCMVAGSEVSTGQTIIGQTVELSPGDLADVGASYVALGHIHKHQAWGNVVYSGSPQRMNFGETEPKGWVLVEIDSTGAASWEFRELPAREIVLEEFDLDDNPGAPPLELANVPGALVRIRYRVAPERLHLVDEDDIRRRLLDAGAHSVKIEPILVHTERQRCAEIVSAADTFGKLNAYWAAKGIVVSDEQRERVRARLGEIEQREGEEVSHAAA